jgi:hypothetical protein
MSSLELGVMNFAYALAADAGQPTASRECSSRSESSASKSELAAQKVPPGSSAGPVGASGCDGANGQSRLCHARMR